MSPAQAIVHTFPTPQVRLKQSYPGGSQICLTSVGLQAGCPMGRAVSCEASRTNLGTAQTEQSPSNSLSYLSWQGGYYVGKKGG